ncbi:MAG: ATP-binding protein [Chloroflexi bacterium]|nr:ATP-binding protein [Chloroflexota bacterium]
MQLSRLWKNTSLSTKSVLLTSLLVILTVVIVSTVATNRERANSRDQFEEQADLLLTALSQDMREELVDFDLNQLEQTTNAIMSNDQITLIRVYDSSGNLLADPITPRAGLSRTPNEEALIILGRSPDDTLYDWREDELIAGRAIALGNRPLGVVRIGISTASIDEQISTSRQNSAITALLISLVAVAATVWLTRQVTNPLSSLTTAVSSVAAGNYDLKIAQKSGDEVGKLAGAVSQMASVIQHREKELREINATLEKRVEERTVELANANERLTDALKEAEEANRLKSEFVATMSHELRTPLNAILGYTQIMQRGMAGEITDRQKDNLSRIFSNSEHLLTLINEILDLSKIEAGRMEIINEPFEIRSVMNDITKRMQALADKKPIQFEVNVHDNVPQTLIADADRVKQITINLISNAIKFTDQGYVKVNVASNNDRWTLVVEDTGTGIPSHMHHTIFEQFRQVDSSSERKHRGTGLGLAIVQKLTLLMNGTVELSSELNKGTTFTVTLPLVAESEAQVEEVK